MRGYIVTFANNTAYEGKFAVIGARSVEEAREKAITRYGAYSVSNVRKDDEYNRELMRFKRFKEINV